MLSSDSEAYALDGCCVYLGSDGTNAIRILLRHGHVRNPYSANGENQRAKLLAAAFHQGNE